MLSVHHALRFRSQRTLFVAFAWLVLCSTLRAQSGLHGEYFDDVQLNQLVEVRIDPQIDFTNWSSSPAGTSVTPDNTYSERWTGFVRIDEPGDWTFSTLSNDGVRLWVDDELIINNWTQHSATTDTGSLALQAGWASVRLEHFQNGGGVVLQLSFEGPDQPKVLIPSDKLAVSPGSTFPQITAPADRHAVVEHGALILTAEGEDDTPITMWRWEQLLGPPASLEGATSKAVRLQFKEPGLHRFRVSGTDLDGNVASDEVDIEVIELGPLGGTASGAFRPWTRSTIDFTGPWCEEQGALNPFTEFRLDVLFVHGESGAAYNVPGFWAADGAAEDTGATAGNVWRVHFTPDRPGQWYFRSSFRRGPNITASRDPNAGFPSHFNSTSGFGGVGEIPSGATGFRAHGRFAREGHYLVTVEDGKPWLKGGTNSPENLLAFADFDQTEPSHLYQPHVGDWNAGDPSWDGGKGRGLIGGINYLASKSMNAIYFLAFSVGGDGDDVWPFTSKTERLRYDVSKLAQWEIAFEHMDELGIAPHIVLQERENDTDLDGGSLGLERSIYHRELVARFGHHNGLIWNLGEETTLSSAQLRDQHDDIELLDPYDHPIVLHTNPFEKEEVYLPLLALNPEAVLDGPSLQNAVTFESHSTTLQWRAESAAAGRPWVLTVDEIGPANIGVVPDANDFWHDGPRKKVLWANLMAGGSGVEWYFGYDFPHDDLDCEDWRSRDHMWSLTSYALEFFDELPLKQMQPADDLVEATETWCLADAGELYAVYMTNAENLSLDLGTSTSLFDVEWFDPGTGEWLSGGVETVQGPGVVSLNNQPSHAAEDLAVRISRINQKPQAAQPVVSPDPFPGDTDLVVSVNVADPDGFSDVDVVRVYFFAPTGQLAGTLTATYVGDDNWQVLIPNLPVLPAGNWPLAIQAVDKSGAQSISFGSLDAF